MVSWNVWHSYNSAYDFRDKGTLKMIIRPDLLYNPCLQASKIRGCYHNAKNVNVSVAKTSLQKNKNIVKRTASPLFHDITLDNG